MASKVIVKLPVTPFGHVNKGKGPAMTATVAAPPNEALQPIAGIVSVMQLEQNIRFLNEQHQLMLTGLHEQIENLRQRNRDLQFQLVFSKGSIAQPQTSAEPNQSSVVDTKIVQHKAQAQTQSPKRRVVNMTSLQVELLERKLSELRIALHEMDTKNVYLTAIVNEQKKQIERNEKEKDEIVRSADAELLNKLDDVESLVRKLRQENDELRHSMSTVTPSPTTGQNRGASSSGGNRHRGHYRGHRFPPLHASTSQQYWQTTRKSLDINSTSNGMSLPTLRQQPAQHTYHRYHGQQSYSGGSRRTPPNNNHHQQHRYYANESKTAGSGGGSGEAQDPNAGSNHHRKYRQDLKTSKM